MFRTRDASLSSANRRAPPPPLPLAKQEAIRAPRFWNAAVNATKGLFNQPSRTPLDDDDVAAPPSVPRVDDRRRLLRKSISTPALKASASTGNLRRDMNEHFSPPLPPLFTNRSEEHSPRKPKFKAAVMQSTARRPVISSPSLPRPLDSIALSNPKFAYPLSPTPSPVGSTFSLNTPAPRSASKIPIHGSQSDDVASVNDDAFNDSRRSRRRTKSAPGSKPNKRPLFSPASSAAQGSESALTEPSSEPSSPIVIDIASPSIASPESAGSPPSPPLETPRMMSGFFSQVTSPPVQITSPRSFTSVKRKPVPHYLYTDPPEHDASTPCTPVLTPNPGSPPSTDAATALRAISGVLHAPLLPSSELILKSCNPSRSNNRGLKLLPIGYTRADGSVRRQQHRRSVSEHGHRRLLSPDGSTGLPSPWFTTDANGFMTTLITPAEEHAPYSFGNDLPAAPHIALQSPHQNPTYVAEEISAFSDNTSVCSSVSRRSSMSRSGALSPLTDEDIDALRCFLRRHATGQRERQRRKCGKSWEEHSRNTSVASYSYDMHTQIVESYCTDEDEFFSLDESEDDNDAESHVPMSASETHSLSSFSIDGHQESLHECEHVDGTGFGVGTPVKRDEFETLDDVVNRGTFGYYGTPIVRMPQSHCAQHGVHDSVPGDKEYDVRPSFPTEWRERGIFGDMSDNVRPSNKEGEGAGIQAEEPPCELTKGQTEVKVVNGPARSSSLCYSASPDYARSSVVDSASCGRISRQPLIPRTLNSDSETDRPISSSTLTSLSPSTSTGRSAFASGIGLAIIPREHFAYFDRYAEYGYVSAGSPSNCGADDNLEGSPTTLACASPSTRSPRQCDSEHDSPFDKLQANLHMLSTTRGDRKLRNNMDVQSPILKPALQIDASRAHAATIVHLPSPTDTIETYPPQTHVAKGHYLDQKLVTPDAKFTASASADEAIPENVKSFMNLTPNDSALRRPRIKLRQLFSRGNLRAAAGRKVSAGSKA